MPPGRPVDWDRLVLVGIVARTHGNRGEVIVNPVTDFADQRFVVGAVLHARRRGGPAVEALTITAARFHSGRPVIGVEGCSSINEAEALVGAELRIDPDAREALPDGVYYHSELVGCEVLTEAGGAVGRVVGVEGEMAQSRLVVRGGRGEVLIPLADAICPRIDVQAKQIVVRPPEGLLDLNEPRPPDETERPSGPGPGGA